MNGDEFSGVAPVITARGILKASAIVLLLSILIVFAAIALVAVVGQHGESATWARWGNVGQTFEAVNSVVSALAVGGILISWAYQSRQMQVARLALQRSVDAEVRNQHVALTQMAINDPHLADVWPSAGGNDPMTRRQYMYANLLIQHVWLQYTTGIATREEMTSSLRYLFASPKVRAFWGDTANSRQSIYVEGTAELGLAAAADEIWSEYQAVVACSADAEARAAENRGWERKNLQDGEPAT
jgi:hypothetical protein